MSKRITAKLVRLAFKIADSTARSDIETECVQVDEGRPKVPGAHWYDSQHFELPALDIGMPDGRTYIVEALDYLEQRGLLIRDPAAPHVVSFREEPA